MTANLLSQLSLAGGVLAGLASSLHCVGMCGGIASSLTLTLAPGAGPMARARTLMLAPAGRVLASVIAGPVLAALGPHVSFGFRQAVALLLLGCGAWPGLG